MPGTIIFKPREAKLDTSEENEHKLDPYCKFKVGWHTGKTSVTVDEGKYARWSEVVCVERSREERLAKMKLKDRNFLGFDGVIGEARIDLEVVVANKKVEQWYSIYDKKNKVTGEVYLEIEYCPPL